MWGEGVSVGRGVWGEGAGREGVSVGRGCVRRGVWGEGVGRGCGEGVGRGVWGEGVGEGVGRGVWGEGCGERGVGRGCRERGVGRGVWLEGCGERVSRITAVFNGARTVSMETPCGLYPEGVPGMAPYSLPRAAT